MKAKKRLLSVLVCLAMGASMVISSAVSASAQSTQFGFNSETLNADASVATFTAGDGTTAQFTSVAAGTSVTVKNSDTVVPGNDSSNKFLKFDYNGDAGDETAARLKITPASPLKKDFVLEFDYALNCVTGSHADYSPYEGFVDLTYFPNVNDTANMWKYGSKAVTIDQTYRVKTPKTNMITPDFWSGYNNYATGYTGNSGFATMKIVTRFIANNYPVYDVYVKIPGASDFTKLVTGKQYADAGYGGASLTASDYNTYGFKYINLDMITGRQAASRTADRVLDAAIDNIRIYDYLPEVTTDFQDATLNADVKAETFTASDGATTQFTAGATGTSVTIKNSDAVVPNNDSSNKFVKFDYNGDAGSDTASRIKITPAAPLTEDFVLQFDYALNREGEISYPGTDRMLDITCFPNVSDTGNMWKYGTKAASISQDFRVKTPVSPSAAITPHVQTGYTTYNDGQYTANTGFATMKVITRFVANDYPVYDVYVKLPEASDFVKVAEDKSYATAGYGGAALTASDYNTGGFTYFYIDMLTGQYAESRIAGNVFDAAIDNIKIYGYDPAEHVIAPTAAPTHAPTNIHLDFDSETLNASLKTETITAQDGTTAQFMNGATGTSVTVKNADSIVSGNASSNKFVKFDYNGDAGDEIASRLRITPAEPINTDFVLEFDYALNCVAGSHADYSPYEGFVDLTFFPVVSDTGNMWKYGSKAVVIDQTYRVKTPKTNMIAPEFWSGYNNYATGYVGNSGFATMKIITRFIANDYPVYDVYVKIPGASDFTKLVDGKQYATSGYGGASLTASDYNTGGFKYIDMDMIAGRQEVSRTADRVLDAAIDNIKIYPYDPTEFNGDLPEFSGVIDFEDDELFGGFNRSYGGNTAASVTYEDGSIFRLLNNVSAGSNLGAVTVTSNGIVPNNTSGNKYMQIEFKGSDYNDETAELRFDFARPFKEDFSIQFKYAVDSNYPVSNSYTGANNATYFTNGYTFVLSANPNASQWNYASRLFYVDGVRTYARPERTHASSAAEAPVSLGVNNLSFGGFETIRIDTEFHNNDVPTYSIYRKAEGRDYWECIAKDVSYSTKYYDNVNWNQNTGGDLTASYYNTNGIAEIAMDFVGDQKYKALSSDHYMKIALDDIKVFKTASGKFEFQNVGVVDSLGNDITAGASINGKTLYPDISVANYFDSAKNITVLIATHNADGLMTNLEAKTVSLPANAVTGIDSDIFNGVTATEEGYVRLYILDGLSSLNPLTEIFTSER